MFQDYVSDVWSEIDHLLNRDEQSAVNKKEVWMNVLGLFQSKADAFGIDRRELGLPIEDADTLFVRDISK